MFDVFKKTRPTKVVDDTEQFVNDFTQRAPFWSYRPVPYKEYTPFYMYQIELDKYIDGLLKAGALDDGNGDVMTNFITDMANKAYADLAKQKTDHEDVIESFFIRSRADQEQFTNELELLSVELEINERDFDEITRRSNKEKFVEGGSNYEKK